MIKINLLYDVGMTAGGKKQKIFVESSSSAPVFSGGSENSQLVTRMVILALPLVLMIGYKVYYNALKESSYKRLQSELQGVQNKLKEYDPVVKELEKFEEEKRKLTAQLQTIKDLSRERLKNVKSLDMLQTIIPTKAWLTLFKIVDKGADIEGMASDDLVISEFIQAMEASVYFSGVRLISSEEQKRADGVVKKFKLKSNLENL